MFSSFCFSLCLPLCPSGFLSVHAQTHLHGWLTVLNTHLPIATTSSGWLRWLESNIRYFRDDIFMHETETNVTDNQVPTQSSEAATHADRVNIKM